MEKAIRKMIMPGVFLTYVGTKKFKTCYMGLNILSPLSKKEAAVNAVIPNVLRRGTAKYPDMESISAALDDMYGARIETIIRKKGEIQCAGFVADFIDDACVPGGDTLFEKVSDFLGELLLNPVLEADGFKAEYFDGERANLVTEIEAQINDKRQYAQARLVELMCPDEAYGTDRLGKKDIAAGLKNKDVYGAYGELLKKSRIEIFFCGGTELSRVLNGLSSALSGLPRADKTTPVGTELIHDILASKTVTEAMDVTQGKLSMGFRTGAGLHDKSYPALLVMNTAFGNSTTSKLFMNVREAMSLCYYASSSLEKHKGLMVVSSGIEFSNFKRAHDEILNQLNACRDGRLEDWELSGAISYMMTALKTTEDSQARLEDFYLGQAAEELDLSPSDLAGKVKNVTLSQVADAASKIRLDTVYFLKNQEVSL